MKESKLMLLQYATAIAALVLVGLHLLMQGVLIPYAQAISFQRVLYVYRDWVTGSLLETLLVVVLLHGFNGLRMILLEWRQSARWSGTVNASIVLAVMLSIAYGTKTILLAIAGGVS
jgi:succinate dehydrogenase / fumarate reductase membrane anchor subunit